MKRELPLVITALVGLVMIVEYFFEIPGASIAAKEMQDWAIIVAAFALAVAAINLALTMRATYPKNGLDGFTVFFS